MIGALSIHQLLSGFVYSDTRYEPHIISRYKSRNFLNSNKNEPFFSRFLYGREVKIKNAVFNLFLVQNRNVKTLQL